MRKEKKFTIWDSENYYSIYTDEGFREEYEGLSEDKLWDLSVEINEEYLEDERVNLDSLDGEPIIIIGNIGRWDGRFSGYKEILSGKVKDCLYSDEDYVHWYVDGLGDFRADTANHDARSYLLYRRLREGLSEIQIENFKEKILRGKIKRKDILRYTTSIGKEIAEVYGWKI